MRLTALAVVLPLALATAGCSQTFSNIGTVLSLDQPQILTNERLYQIHLAYETLQVAAVSIRRNVPQCRAGQAPAVTAVCYPRSSYVILQSTVGRANKLVGEIDAWARNNPTIDAKALIEAFNLVVGQGTEIANSITAGRG